MNAPPSIALAIMAAKLAMHREYGEMDLDDMSLSVYAFVPTERIWCAGKGGLELYRILDRLSAGEQP